MSNITLIVVDNNEDNLLTEVHAKLQSMNFVEKKHFWEHPTYGRTYIYKRISGTEWYFAVAGIKFDSILCYKTILTNDEIKYLYTRLYGKGYFTYTSVIAFDSMAPLFRPAT